MPPRKRKAIAQPSEEEEGLELSSPSSEIVGTSNDDTSSKLSVDVSVEISTVQKVKSKPSTVRKKRGRRPTTTKKPKQNNGSSSSPSLSIKEEIQQVEVKPEEEEVEPHGRFVGEPIPMEEARKRWPKRYEQKEKGSRASSSKQNYDEEEGKLKARCHYMQAEVDDIIYNLHDDVSVQGVEGADYIGRILEFFETNDNEAYFTAQWFYKAEDTVIKNRADHNEKKRVFISILKDDNPLSCILSKLKIIKVDPNIDLVAKKSSIPPCDYYYDMSYSLPYTTFANVNDGTSDGIAEIKSKKESQKSEYALLDLYSGCGAMSTGLCLGASVSDVNLVTRWAVDVNEFACQSLSLNHPETKVRNEAAEDFLFLLKEWMKLCKKFSLLGTKIKSLGTDESQPIKAEENGDVSKSSHGEFEVENLVDICYGDPNKVKKSDLYFKVQWKGYGPDEDTWEPYNGLSNCQEKIQDFVMRGYNSRLLPLPGDVDVVCGGPPCQGISGHNRFRNMVDPLQDPQNRQLSVFMDIVEYLKPKFVLMENVVDILKLARGDLGRYALSRLVSMNYQARIGMMTAGCYGLPQFRMRVFLWGAHPNEILPQYPLPTHEVIVRGNIPTEFERCTVAYDEDQPRNLEKALVLSDAISDLPSVKNDEVRDEMPYQKAPQTKLQKFIRLSQNELMCSTLVQDASLKPMLRDHRPLKLNNDDYERVCQIPKKKGANFRDLRGVVVVGNRVEFSKSVERVLLSSGKHLVPNYAMSFMDGTSVKPFGRLWWNETVPTVVTRAEPHNQVILHPEQDRVLSIRENARLQGFPDYYHLCGPVKARYIQVGNAVAVPVGRALGYCLGLACRGVYSDEPLLILPPKFSFFLSPEMTTDGSDFGLSSQFLLSVCLESLLLLLLFRLFHVMSLDFTFWVYNDMTARKWLDKGSWILPLALIPFLGPALYIVLRPPVSAMPVSLPSTTTKQEFIVYREFAI